MAKEAQNQLIGGPPPKAVVLHQLEGDFLMQGVQRLNAAAPVEHPEGAKLRGQLRIGSRRQVDRPLGEGAQRQKQQQDQTDQLASLAVNAIHLMEQNAETGARGKEGPKQ